ncbi:MAG: thioredoxin family protein [Proteobacteria bacterium]|nr:thioredoxin family protein [Pseudomonadota bacterium]
MRRFVFALLLAVTATVTAAAATQWPYDEKADAAADVQHALGAAQADHLPLLLVFGANWCKDCRDLDHALKGSSHALIDGHFHVVKIDVGNFDKNLPLVQKYDNPIQRGIPAVVVVSPDNRVIYSTRGGELADARRMGDTGIYDFLAAKLPGAPAAAAGKP